MKPTREDAAIVLLLAQWSTLLDLPHMLSRLTHTGNGPAGRRTAPGSELPGQGDPTAICDYFEMVGLLHRYGLVNEELLFDWLRVSQVWDQIKQYVMSERRTRAAPRLWSNFEALAVAHKRVTREYST